MNVSTRGSDFERDVNSVLSELQTKFPARVRITAQRSFPDALRPHRADFELEYELGGLTHQHLIECQSRNRSSHEIADKIVAVRATSDRNRYILVYKDQDYLSQPVEQRLKSMGVLCFSLEGFKRDFIAQLEADIALHELGLAVSQRLGIDIKPDVLKALQLIAGKTTNPDEFIKRLTRLQESATKWDPVRQSPPDRAMSS